MATKFGQSKSYFGMIFIDRDPRREITYFLIITVHAELKYCMEKVLPICCIDPTARQMQSEIKAILTVLEILRIVHHYYSPKDKP